MKDAKRKISVLSLQSGLSANNTQHKQGWMKKQGGKRKNWKTRLFILSDNILYYYRAEKDTQPKGLIPLNSECKVEFVEDGGGEDVAKSTTSSSSAPEKWSLKIHTPWRVYWLCNEQLEEVSSWVSALTTATQISAKNRHANAIKEGWLAKGKSVLNNWKSWKWRLRYMVLKNDALYYYERPDSDIAIGCVALLNATLEHNDPTKTIKSPKIDYVAKEEAQSYLLSTDPNTDTSSLSDGDNTGMLEYGFKISNDTSSYLMYALKQSECDKWTMALQKAILDVMSRLATSRVVGESQIEQEQLLKGEEIQVSTMDDEIITESNNSLRASVDLGRLSTCDYSTDVTPEISVENTDACNQDDITNAQTGDEVSEQTDKRSSPRVSVSQASPRKLEEFSYLVAHFILQEIQDRANDEKELKEFIKEARKNASRLSSPSETSQSLSPRDRSRSLISQSAINVLQEQNIDPNMIPIKLKLKPGIYKEESIKLNRPIEIEGSGIDETIIVLFTSARANNLPLLNINSANVRLKNLTLKIYGNDLEDEINSASASKIVQGKKASLYDTYKSVVHVSSGSCFLENCKLLCEQKTTGDNTYVSNQKTCGVLVSNTGRCYLHDSQILSDYGFVVTNMGFCCSKGGIVKAKLNPVKKLSGAKLGSDVRMYETKVTSR